jgi:hypothetical protein
VIPVIYTYTLPLTCLSLFVYIFVCCLVVFKATFINISFLLLEESERLPCPWSYGNWINNYLCNQCLSPLMFEFWSGQGAQHYVIKFEPVTCDRSMVFTESSGFLHLHYDTCFCYFQTINLLFWAVWHYRISNNIHTLSVKKTVIFIYTVKLKLNMKW